MTEANQSHQYTLLSCTAGVGLQTTVRTIYNADTGVYGDATGAARNKCKRAKAYNTKDKSKSYVN